MTDLETKARTETTCRGCGKPKETGPIVCWNCWHDEDHGFKYFDGTLEEWLKPFNSELLNNN